MRRKKKKKEKEEEEEEEERKRGGRIRRRKMREKIECLQGFHLWYIVEFWPPFVKAMFS